MTSNLEEDLTVLLSSFERDLRAFLKKIIGMKLGKKWFMISEPDRPIIEDVKQRAKTLLEISLQKMRRLGEGCSNDLFDYLEFNDYLLIIKEYWTSKNGKPFFNQYFPSQEFVVNYLEYLNIHRNDIKGHNRAILTQDVEEKIRFYIKDFTKHLFTSQINIGQLTNRIMKEFKPGIELSRLPLKDLLDLIAEISPESDEKPFEDLDVSLIPPESKMFDK